MVLFQLIMRMEVGIAIGEMLGAGVEEEDAASVVVEGEGTMGPMLICSMIEDTTKMHLKAVVLNPYYLLFILTVCGRSMFALGASIRLLAIFSWYSGSG